MSFNPSSYPPIFFTSIPKCGKNIIYSLLFSIGYRHKGIVDETFYHYSNLDVCQCRMNQDHYLNKYKDVGSMDLAGAQLEFENELTRLVGGELFHCHLYPNQLLVDSLTRKSIKTMFIYRDPRDCLLSAAHYAHDQHKPRHTYEKVKDLSFEDTVMYLLEGDEGLLPFHAWYDKYYSYSKNENVFTTRFEDIIGLNGGGEEKVQQREFDRLLEFLGIFLDEQAKSEALSKAFNPKAGTFRSGQIGGWRQGLNEQAKKRFMELDCGMLEKWGYSIEGDRTAYRFPAKAIELIISSLIDIRKEKEELASHVKTVTEELAAARQEIVKVRDEANMDCIKATEKIKEEKSNVKKKLMTTCQKLEESDHMKEALEAKLVKANLKLVESTSVKDALEAKLVKASRKLEESNQVKVALEAKIAEISSKLASFDGSRSDVSSES